MDRNVIVMEPDSSTADNHETSATEQNTEDTEAEMNVLDGNEIGERRDVGEGDGQQAKKLDQIKRKRLRKRRRIVYKTIRKQMEFYFGDANLTRDRFLSKLIATDPFVPISTFMTFNKIKTLARTERDIIKSLKDSEMLRLSDDQTKVRRCTDIQIRDDIDERTIYVETLPEIANHDLINSIFKEYGNIVYISIPKYRNSQKIKGFAFIEYELKDSVIKALKAFKGFGGILSKGENDIETMCSISSYVKEQQNEAGEVVVADETMGTPAVEGALAVAASTEPTVERKEKETVMNVDENNTKPKATIHLNLESNIESDASTGSKRKLMTNVDQNKDKVDKTKVVRDDDDDDDDKPPNKKIKKSKKAFGEISKNKTPSDDNVKEEVANIENKNDDDVQVGAAIEDDDAGDDDNNDPNTDKPTNNKKSHKRKQSSPLRTYRHELSSKVMKELRITTKLEWKKLRNKYLNYQREQMKIIKKKLRATAFESKTSNRFVTNNQQLNRKMNANDPRNKNFYRNTNTTDDNIVDDQTEDNDVGAIMEISTPTATAAHQDDEITSMDECMTMTTTNSKTIICKMEYTPNTIVKFKFNQPCVHIQLIKRDLRKLPYVKYVDVKEGDLQAYVRVADESNGSELLNAIGIFHKTTDIQQHQYERSILGGQEELDYWTKINADREQKFNKEIKIKPVRGRVKIARKIKNFTTKNHVNSSSSSASTHIRFDEDE